MCALWRRRDINLCNAKHLSSLAIFCAELSAEFVHHDLSGKTTSDIGRDRHPDGMAPMSALPPKADIGTQSRNVCFVPKADIPHCSEESRYSITSSARAESVGGISNPSVFAVFRLITNWKLIGSITGRSPGFSPLRMRPA